jgi:glycine cleavage system aminomethyltransferase T
MSDQLARTALHSWHVARQARMVEFGGWSMPVQYTSIVDEHHATRRAVGLFDISHMGRLRFDGKVPLRFSTESARERCSGLVQEKFVTRW